MITDAWAHTITDLGHFQQDGYTYTPRLRAAELSRAASIRVNTAKVDLGAPGGGIPGHLGPFNL